MTFSRRLMNALIAALSVSLVLAGCVAIPRAGIVHGEEVASKPNEIDVIFQPAGPSVDASKEEIIDGFIQAALNPENNFAVAREFLAPNFADEWKPADNVIIDIGSRPITISADGSVGEIRISPTAELDERGIYTETDSTTPVSLGLSMTKVQGQWRINSAKFGAIMTQTEFEQVYRQHALYFYDPSYQFLVPDVRWFPNVTATGTMIVSQLLLGPSASLDGGAVVTAFPEGTSVTSVPIESGNAHVDLSEQVLQASPDALRRMQFQLDASLGSIIGVVSVSMAVLQNPLTVSTAGARKPTIDPRVSSQALASVGGTFGFVSGDKIAQIDGISDQVEALDAQSVAYSERRGLAAVLSGVGVSLVAEGTGTALIDSRSRLIAPTMDAEGFVWTVPAGDPTAISVVSAGRNPSSIAGSWDEANTIHSLEVSRDGTRVIALLSINGVPRLVVASVIRESDGTPVELGEPVTLRTGSGTAIAATWVDSTTIISATALPDGSSMLISQELGGPSAVLESAAGVTQIAGGNELSGVRLLGAENTLYQWRGNGWQPSTTDVNFLAIQVY